MTRRAGLLIPLFSFPSSSSWGIGEIGDIAPMAAWLKDAGHSVLQLLPLNEMADGEQSPYSALSAMAVDPIYIRLQDVSEFAAIGGEAALDEDDRRVLRTVRQSSVVDYRSIRRIKEKALTAAFDRFVAEEWERSTARASSLAAFVEQESWWLQDYALYRAIQHREGKRPWTEWPEKLQRRDPDSLSRARRELSREILRFEYLQWLANEQWRAAQASARDKGVALFGDLPFMVNLDSADVWIRQHQFRLDVSVGAPPDAFSATGQNWGVPACNWEVMADDDFAWIRERARRGAALFEGYRVDHLVGFYRTYCRPRDGTTPFFSPASRPRQLRLGERVLRVFAESGAEIIAEDLGTVPNFVRLSLKRLGVPGYRVFRWEREWSVPGHPFCDPLKYPDASVVASGTHDTEPMTTWWEQAPADERARAAELPIVRRLAGGQNLTSAPYDPTVRDVLLEAIYASGSDLVLNVVQDVFGWRDRVNDPAVISNSNWSFRLPWFTDRLDDIQEAQDRQARLREWSRQYGRAMT
jgi:4-alpha-glucanotransferase